MQGGANVYFVRCRTDTCILAPAPYYKLNKGFFLGFLFKLLCGLCPPRGLNKKAEEKSFIYYIEMEKVILKPYSDSDKGWDLNIGFP